MTNVIDHSLILEKTHCEIHFFFLRIIQSSSIIKLAIVKIHQREIDSVLAENQ